MLPILHQLFGSVLVIAGLIVLPLPIPLGLIMLALGFALLAPYIPAVQRFLTFLRGKWPKLNETLLRYHSKLPPIIRKTIDKTHPAAPAE